MNLRTLATFPLFAVIITACGASGSSTAPTATPAPTPAPAGTPPALQGSFTTTLALQDFATDQCENAGTYTLTISGTRFSFSQVPAAGCSPHTTVIPGNAFGSDDQIQFTEDANNGCARNYTYRSVLSADQVRFTKVDDSCTLRVTILTKYPWTRR